MVFNALRSNIHVKDDVFNEIYPPHIKELAQRHWTPVDVARMAAEYLAESPNCKVLDIGAGAGKFCLVGAACTEGMFYGVEQRESLTKISTKIARNNGINNVEFIHSNIDRIEFSDFDSFYFYNSFYENIDTSCPIDKNVHFEEDLFHTYSNYVRDQLDRTPIGTRVVTYWSNWEEIPKSFDLKHSAYNGLLNFWWKIA